MKRRPRPPCGLDPGLGQRAADGVAVVDHEAEVAALVGTLAAALGDGQELVAEVEEAPCRGTRPRSSNVEQAAVELERGVEVADLERDVVDADQAGGAHYRHLR